MRVVQGSTCEVCQGSLPLRHSKTSQANDRMTESVRWGMRRTGELLSIEEIRLITDLRIMHSKVHELSHIVASLRQRHCEEDILKYADAPVLAEDIHLVDEIYLWYVKIKEERERGKADHA